MEARPSVSIRTEVPRELPPPEAANFFHFAYFGSDVELLLGCVGLAHLFQDLEAARRAKSDHFTVVPMLTHRIVMSPGGFELLYQKIREVRATMIKQGYQPPTERGDEDE